MTQGDSQFATQGRPAQDYEVGVGRHSLKGGLGNQLPFHFVLIGCIILILDLFLLASFSGQVVASLILLNFILRSIIFISISLIMRIEKNY